MRKAIVIGIDEYPGVPLEGCKNDAAAFCNTIQTNGDGSPNFEAILRTDITTRAQLSDLAENVFKGECDVALFYFSGHGHTNKLGSFLVTPDAKGLDTGLSMEDLLKLANESEAKNRVIILDCCNSGSIGTSELTGGNISSLKKGVTILTASRQNESAIEINGHGVFTNLLLAALQGGAADVKGDITPGSIYAFIDQALGAWDQRPVFKTNVTEFCPLRHVTAKVDKRTLRKLAAYFPSAGHEFPLDPSFEYTNSKEIEHNIIEPYAIEKNVEQFKDLQKFQSVGLVVPVDSDHMYFAAMESKTCRLTALGAHYWKLAKERRI
ncbi:Caspase domain-containing protein [Filimonas lacunae]|uniref:Caspase domain-containing protein n=1 Tax=Filimonas lacunae TaxID=477680 RepID=A0A173MHC0_9BACT|nr:caspase family protein [Filimonas lacunae]BAV07012.1 high-affnity carbon uptake protein Hat/HatR [Filimonas lacunae]SIS96399.1 Caspase domain-containing protein [Filimonas lacunae]